MNDRAGCGWKLGHSCSRKASGQHRGPVLHLPTASGRSEDEVLSGRAASVGCFHEYHQSADQTSPEQSRAESVQTKLSLCMKSWAEGKGEIENVKASDDAQVTSDSQGMAVLVSWSHQNKQPWIFWFKTSVCYPTVLQVRGLGGLK